MANTSTSYDLGLLKGNTWRQWADASGMAYYQNLVTQVTTFELPASWEDVAGVGHPLAPLVFHSLLHRSPMLLMLDG